MWPRPSWGRGLTCLHYQALNADYFSLQKFQQENAKMIRLDFLTCALNSTSQREQILVIITLP